MKNVIKTLKKSILLAAIFSTLFSNAHEIFSLETTKGDLKKTVLTIDNVKKGNFLSIKNYNGIILYKELIGKKGVYNKGFDLTVLPDGNYFFELDKDLEIKIIPFSVESNVVVFSKNEETTIFKPLVIQKDNKILVSKLAPKYEPLKIRIYGKNYEGDFTLLHTEKIEGIQTIKRIYSLKKGNSYKIVFNSNNREFTELIEN